MALEKTENEQIVPPTDSAPENQEPEPQDEKTEPAEVQPLYWQDLLGSGSILRKVLTEGKPDTHPVRQQKCTISYALYLGDENGRLIDQNDNFELYLGECDVLPGLDVALGLINVGEKCQLKIEGRLAFGEVGLQPDVPPNASVMYEVELKAVEDERLVEELTVIERKAIGNRKREKGNWWYGRGENTLAIQCYRRALDYLDEVECGINFDKPLSQEVSDSTLQDLLEARISVYNNMAAAQIKLELYDAALLSLQTVLRCQPTNVKALFRKAKVHRARSDLNAALMCLRKANEVSPNNLDIQKEITSVNKLIQKHKVSERELAKRMFGDKVTPAKDNKDNSTKRNFLLWSATLAASFAMGLVGVAVYRLRSA